MTDKERADQLAAENAKLKVDLEKSTASVDDAVKADRERRASIMALPEAKGREALAEHLFTNGNSVDQAKATLSVSPKGGEEDEEVEFEPRRLNAQGLNTHTATHKPKSGERKTFLTAAVDRTNKRR